MLNALIVDDEANCCEVLELLLKKHCPQVNVVASCNSVAQAIKALETYSVQLVFLDIEMPHSNGFELLQRLPVIDFALIFTTSYDQYAIKAIRFSALDYLLKPIDREELQAAVRKAELHSQPIAQRQMEILFQKLAQGPKTNHRIALPTLEGLQMISVDFIISCTSKSNYTTIVLKEAPKLVVSKTLKEMESLLCNYGFLRVHHSHMVNINEVRKYIRGEGGLVMMSNGTAIDVSRSRKESLLRALQSSS